MVKLFGFISSDIGSDYTQPEMGWLSEEDSYPVDQSAWMNKKRGKKKEKYSCCNKLSFCTTINTE
jgi:hypothetical protein